MYYTLWWPRPIILNWTNIWWTLQRIFQRTNIYAWWENVHVCRCRRRIWIYRYFKNNISGVVSLGVTGLVALSVPVHGIPGDVASIPRDVESVFPGVDDVSPLDFPLSLSFLFSINLDFNGSFNLAHQFPTKIIFSDTKTFTLTLTLNFTLTLTLNLTLFLFLNQTWPWPYLLSLGNLSIIT